MSGWIKWEKDLENDPRVLRMVRELKLTCNAPALPERTFVTLVSGALLRLWSYADTHIREDDTLDLGAKDLDGYIGVDHFCSVLPADWFKEIDENTVELPGFQAHNGVEARKKALTQKRVETHRKRKGVTPALTTALPDQTKTRPRPEERANGHSSALPTDVTVVFDHWKQTHERPRSKLDDKRAKVIRVALKVYTVEQLCQSISGYKHSPFHMGQNDRKKPFTDIELLLRDAQHIDEGIRFGETSSADPHPGYQF